MPASLLEEIRLHSICHLLLKFIIRFILLLLMPLLPCKAVFPPEKVHQSSRAEAPLLPSSLKAEFLLKILFKVFQYGDSSLSTMPMPCALYPALKNVTHRVCANKKLVLCPLMCNAEPSLCRYTQHHIMKLILMFYESSCSILIVVPTIVC